MFNAVKKASLLLVPLIFISASSAEAVSQDSSINFSVFSAANTQLSYLDGGLNPNNDNKQQKVEISKDQSLAANGTDKKPAKKKAAKAKPVVYTVSKGDTLTLIAKKYKISWQRIYDKNTKLDSPDIIDIGAKLTIPKKGEKLKKRTLPSPTIETANYTSQENYPAIGEYSQPVQPIGDTSGNTYYPGYCTWYVKNRRPDIPNMLGDAISWVASAQARGMATGSTPRVGAVGQEGNHVVYVEKVNNDGTVLVSEMNYHGLYVTSQRTAPASNFMYIY